MGLGDFVKELPKIFLNVAKEHGPFIGITIIFFVFLGSLVIYLIRTTIRTYKDEINRLAGERNKLLDYLLVERKSSSSRSNSAAPEGEATNE